MKATGGGCRCNPDIQQDNACDHQRCHTFHQTFEFLSQLKWLSKYDDRSKTERSKTKEQCEQVAPQQQALVKQNFNSNRNFSLRKAKQRRNSSVIQAAQVRYEYSNLFVSQKASKSKAPCFSTRHREQERMDRCLVCLCRNPVIDRQNTILRVAII